MPEHIVQKPKKILSTSAKAALITIPAVLVIVAVLIITTMLNRPQVGDENGNVPMVQPNSHVLNDAGEGAPVLVEFLDLECEACGAVYPIMEQIRAQYDGKLTYVVRYFNTNHSNSMNAALAAEAAAGQGRFEEMFRKLFESQAEWGEQQSSQAERFRGYAESLGLDMAAYDAALAAPETRARIEEDHNAGLALGVRGTPTFFLNGQELQPQMVSDLTDAIDAAIAAQTATS